MEPQTVLPCSLCLKDRGDALRGGHSHHPSLSSSLACCSLYLTLSFSCLEARRRGQCGGGLSPTQPTLAVVALPKQPPCLLLP